MPEPVRGARTSTQREWKKVLYWFYTWRKWPTGKIIWGQAIKCFIFIYIAASKHFVLLYKYLGHGNEYSAVCGFHTGALTGTVTLTWPFLCMKT